MCQHVYYYVYSVFDYVSLQWLHVFKCRRCGCGKIKA